MVWLNGNLQLVIPGCELQLSDFEPSLGGGRWSNHQLFDQSILSVSLVIGVRARYWVVNWISSKAGCGVADLQWDVLTATVKHRGDRKGRIKGWRAVLRVLTEKNNVHRWLVDPKRCLFARRLDSTLNL